MVSLERRGLLTVTAFAGLLIFTTVHAAETATIVANEVIVTGSLEDTVPQDLAKLGHDLVTVSNQIIKDKSYLDVSSALQFEVPGLYLAQRAGPFSYVDLSLQGSRSQDVLWTVDGVRINNRLYSTTAPTDTLPASMIERIEVLKGGESLFFGTQGVAGTINLVTRSFSDRFGGEMTLHGDTNSGRHMDGLIRGAAGQHRYVLFASQDKSDGFVAYDAYQPSATARKRPYDLTTAGLKYEFALNRDLALSMSYIHTDAEIGYPVT